MSTKLFAFKISKPLEKLAEDQLVGQYDPQTQIMQWQGETRPQAIHCTNYYNGGGNTECNAYGDYCTTWRDGIGYGWFYYACDS
jgi:hypothetical protein